VSSRIPRTRQILNFATSGLSSLTPFTRVDDEREATYNRCGTWRRVTLRSVCDPERSACRWCDGWKKWTSWGIDARDHARTRRSIRGAVFSASQIRITGPVAPTKLGDEFTPVGCLCVTRGETLVIVPERVDPRRPCNCQRCHGAQTRVARTRTADAYVQAGLRLLSPVPGQWTKHPTECLIYDQFRHISYQQVIGRSTPACWTCTHGIRPDEPHRVYLIRFPALGVLKVGIKHNRHNGRIIEHLDEGGQLLETAVVPDLRTALAVEASVLATKSAWLRRGVGPEHFPQSGSTEAWSEAGTPAVKHLAETCDKIAIIDANYFE
jgi:hypothetical protein